MPSLARSVQKRLKVPSLACSVQKPLNQPECRTSIARLIKPASQPVGDQPRSSQPASKLATNKRIGGQQRQGWYQPSWYLHSFLTISLQPHPLHGTRAEVRKEWRYQPGSCWPPTLWLVFNWLAGSLTSWLDQWLWNEMKRKWMISLWVFDFYETFIYYKRVLKLNFYIEKKCRKISLWV